MPRGSSNYIPRPDSQFSAWAERYCRALVRSSIARHLDPGQLTALQHALERWTALFSAHLNARDTAASARRAKDEARAALERAVRPVTRSVQCCPQTTDADRAELAICTRTPDRTRAPIPRTRPRVRVELAGRLAHTLRLADEGADPSGAARALRGGKPAGVMGAEVWYRLVAPNPFSTPEPVDPVDDPGSLTFLTMTTRPKLRTTFPAAAAGSTAVYLLRWVNTRGERGPWSEPTAATIAA